MTLPILLGLTAPAEAVDLDELVLGWTNTIDGQHGTDGQDQAAAVTFDDDEHVLAVGWLDGAVDHGTDGYAVAWEDDSTVQWEITEDAGLIGVDRLSSSDRLGSIWIEPSTQDLAFCGRRGAADLDDPEGRFLVERYTESAFGAAPLLDWEFTYIYGVAATSPIQECFGVDWTLFGFMAAGGWGVHGADQGAWVGLKLDDDSHVIDDTWFYNDQPYLAAPDQVYGIAANEISGDVVMVGQRGFSGADGSVLNDSDWYVRAVDANGVLLWEDTYAGSKFLDDRATAVAVDLNSQDIYVVGWTNKGSDNGAGADYDWMITRYHDAGDGLGGPDIVWTRTWESVPGASEGATAITLDEDGEPLVAGWAMDASGQEVWRLAKLTGKDGSDGQSWQDIAHGGNSRPSGVAYDEGTPGQIALAGYIDTGSGRDFAAIFLDGDLDGDGYADGVDVCPDDPDKNVDDGLCGCNNPDLDNDGDGTVGCLEDCPLDPDKTDEGVCGCGVPDDDTDADGTEDCIDNCPTDANKIDAGECGCGAPDTDADDDGILGCHDACSNTPPGAHIDEFGCPLPGNPDDTGDPASSGGGGGCGCASDGGVMPGALGILAALVVTARSRRRYEKGVSRD